MFPRFGLVLRLVLHRIGGLMCRRRSSKLSGKSWQNVGHEKVTPDRADGEPDGVSVEYLLPSDLNKAPRLSQ